MLLTILAIAFTLLAIASKIIRKEFDFLFTIFIVASTICVFIATSKTEEYENKVATLREDYQIIQEYNEILVDVESELMRFNHFNRINNYNTRYEEVAIAAENPWYGSAVPKDWNFGISTIEFKFSK